jgi:hypothetical protein
VRAGQAAGQMRIEAVLNDVRKLTREYYDHPDDTEARDRLVLAYQPFIRKLAKRVARHVGDRDDLINAGLAELLAAEQFMVGQSWRAPDGGPSAMYKRVVLALRFWVDKIEALAAGTKDAVERFHAVERAAAKYLVAAPEPEPTPIKDGLSMPQRERAPRASSSYKDWDPFSTPAVPADDGVDVQRLEHGVRVRGRAK